MKAKLDEEVPCKDHPLAPHEFMRDASHSEGRYVCECHYWEEPEDYIQLNREVYFIRYPRGQFVMKYKGFEYDIFKEELLKFLGGERSER